MTTMAAVPWRSGYDNHQHAAPDPRTASCGEPVRDQRYDRPDWPRCIECLAIEGIVVPAPSASIPAWLESELRSAHGDR